MRAIKDRVVARSRYNPTRLTVKEVGVEVGLGDGREAEHGSDGSGGAGEPHDAGGVR